MGSICLVRHGQASFGAENYDNLSPLGVRQCVRLGEHLRLTRRRFDAVWLGALQRHRQTLDAIAQGYGALPEALVDEALNEYDSHALIHALPPDSTSGSIAADAAADEVRRHHFRRLRAALSGWVEGRLEPAGMPRHAEFKAGVLRVLDAIRQRHHGQCVLLVSSGGPISTAVAQVLGAPNTAAIDLNMRLRNSALTEFEFTPKRHLLLSFNTLPHLEHPDTADWVTYA